MAVKNTLARTSVLCKIILVHVAREQDKFFRELVHTLCLCFIIVKAILSFIVSVCSELRSSLMAYHSVSRRYDENPVGELSVIIDAARDITWGNLY